jgi:hypothetical protein
MSLKHALETLGFGPCYHMVEVFKDRDRRSAQWEAAADGHPDWEAIFDGYNSTVDWPNATFYRELAAVYPDAKVILTERDPEDWWTSTQATIFNNLVDGDDAQTDPWKRMVGKVVGDLFERRMHDKDKCIAVYKAHNAKVREVIPPERLLVYYAADGWAPLCEFLGVDVPEGAPPKANTTEDFKAMIAARMAEAEAAKA